MEYYVINYYFYTKKKARYHASYIFNSFSISFEYIDKLLSDWHEKGLLTVSDVNTYLDSLKTKEKKTKQIKQIALEYTQSTFDNWDALYEN